ncbi:putative multidrug resistance protein NorM [Trichinella pseudospiralis]
MNFTKWRAKNFASIQLYAYLEMKSVSKITSVQLVRDSRFLQFKLIVEPESNKILTLYPITTSNNCRQDHYIEWL